MQEALNNLKGSNVLFSADQEVLRAQQGLTTGRRKLLRSPKRVLLLTLVKTPHNSDRSAEKTPGVETAETPGGDEHHVSGEEKTLTEEKLSGAGKTSAGEKSVGVKKTAGNKENF